MQITSTKKNLDESLVEISVIIPTEIFIGYEDAAVKSLSERIEIPGFRKGKATKEALIKHTKDSALLEEMAELALAEHYPNLIKEHALDPIGRPNVQITKIARGNPLEFKIVTAIVPEINLPDYKKIAADAMKKNYTQEVTDADIEKTLLEIRKMRAHQKLHENPEGDQHNHDHGDALDEKNLPVLDDAFVKSLGAFENVEDFKKRLHENVKSEKEREGKDKQRIALLDALIEGTKTTVPEVMVTAEQEKMFARMSHEIEQAGMKTEEYLKHIKKTKEELFKEWKTDAEKNAVLELTIDAIARKENLKPSEKEIHELVETLLKQYAGADKMRTEVYAEHMLTNQKVISFLEEQK